MSHEGRASRNSPHTAAEHVSRDGVASAAGGPPDRTGFEMWWDAFMPSERQLTKPIGFYRPIALVTTFDRPEIVTRIEVGDPDAFDDPGCLVYQAGDA